MKKFLKNYWFILCMLAGIVAGCLVGAFAPSFGSKIEFLGTLFINMMFCVVVPMVFCSIASAIANMKSVKRAGKIMGVTIATFLVTAAIAGVLMYIVCRIFPLVDGHYTIVEGEVGEALGFGDMIVNFFTKPDFVELLSRRAILPLIVAAVLFGFGGGFVVVPFVYQLMLRQPAIAGNAMHVAVATSTAVMIFNAGWVSYRNWRAGRLAAQTLFPLLWFIAIGAVVGSCLAGILSENIVRALFILYMLATISDCLLRKGFFTGSARRRLSLPVVTGGGVIIGTIAALLGVGGSVMTVPLLRRHGYAMQECVSASNPLSLPVALCGAVTYAVIGWHSIPLSGFLGFISLKILGLLVLTGWAGIVFSRRAIPAVPDVWYARIYVLLLCLVLLAMLIQ